MAESPARSRNFEQLEHQGQLCDPLSRRKADHLVHRIADPGEAGSDEMEDFASGSAAR
jgi:hypothetical protein